MCGRFNLHDDPFLRQLLAELGVGPLSGERVNIAPTEPVPVVFEEEGERRLHAMRWWLVPSWAPAIATQYAMFNAKSETLSASKAFRGPARHRRCIVPASSFIEWTLGGTRKLPWLIRPREGAIAFAGIWDLWERDGAHLESCTIITTAAVGGIERLHARMPLMLRSGEFDAWLDCREGTAPAAALLAPRLPTAFEVAPLSGDVNNARHKQASLLSPIGPWQPLDAQE